MYYILLLIIFLFFLLLVLTTSSDNSKPVGLKNFIKGTIPEPIIIPDNIITPLSIPFTVISSQGGNMNGSPDYVTITQAGFYIFNYYLNPTTTGPAVYQYTLIFTVSILDVNGKYLYNDSKIETHTNLSDTVSPITSGSAVLYCEPPAIQFKLYCTGSSINTSGLVITLVNNVTDSSVLIALH